ncbi:ADP-ribose pyrophosphatase YjhB (NUDIX family) [Nocardioides daedukensis]|uniref:ADP-ribose pyrophosphatase YjhB (NUDIX family) n=1 Tax=Nocardioides daedukensis TaxID=634462 RepID=A0A7Y9S051_9ACTN|nr:NUDIX domain-containing protein [Nocardioides daedukensis]NYG57813.1 ADP-ribose pyrophosphatase YjhB (NUDIX family) [Nocardioides daedukensis]
MRRFASVLLVDRRGWLLLQERDEFPEIDPECWGCPGGHMEAGETALEAAYREFAEETGVTLSEGTLRHWRDLSVRHAGRDGDDLVHLFLAPTDLTDADVTCMEGRQILFVDPADVPGLPLTRAAALALDDFLASTDYRSLFEHRETR